jgi:hypothetical protein
VRASDRWAWWFAKRWIVRPLIRNVRQVRFILLMTGS